METTSEETVSELKSIDPVEHHSEILETVKESPASCEESESTKPLLFKSRLPLTPLRTELLDCVAQSDEAYFKSQQKNDPELSCESKRFIAEELLDRSPAQFLARYGKFMQEHHLQYFLENSKWLKEESYEIEFHLNQLKRFHCKATHDIDVKNRRYDAMKKMIAEGHSYFSEDEMRQRNPYLYEQLVGQYLSDEERKEKQLPDIENITFVNLLLTKISRDETVELRKQQEREENGDDSTSYDEDSDSNSDSEQKQNEREGGTWGETPEKKTKIMLCRKKASRKKRESIEPAANVELSVDERVLLMHEFLTSMYNSFIDGKDTDFDYSQVDCNPDFDCVDVRERDEEEKYFDEDTTDGNIMDVDHAAENIEHPPPLQKRQNDEEEEDALDVFMRTVVPSAPSSDLTLSFQNLCRQSRSQPSERSRVKKHVIKINIKKGEASST